MIIQNSGFDSGQVLGAFEEVVFPAFDDASVTAKVDTGAYSGAIHCVKIQEKNQVLYYTPFQGRQLYKSENFAVRHVRSSNGQRERRYFIRTTIIIGGRTLPIIISLTDRSDMKWPVLIGRRFLRQNKFLVDATRTND